MRGDRHGDMETWRLMCTCIIYSHTFIFIICPSLCTYDVFCLQGVRAAVQPAYGERGHLHVTASCSRGIPQHGLFSLTHSLSHSLILPLPLLPLNLRLSLSLSLSLSLGIPSHFFSLRRSLIHFLSLSLSLPSPSLSRSSRTRFLVPPSRPPSHSPTLPFWLPVSVGGVVRGARGC